MILRGLRRHREARLDHLDLVHIVARSHFVRACLLSIHRERTDSRTTATTTIFLTVSRTRLLCRRFARQQHLLSELVDRTRYTQGDAYVTRTPSANIFHALRAFQPFHRGHGGDEKKMSAIRGPESLSSSGLRTPTNLESASGLPAIRLLTGRHLAPIAAPSPSTTLKLYAASVRCTP